MLTVNLVEGKSRACLCKATMLINKPLCFQLYESLPPYLSSRLMETAREMTRESLPIKCLEAVILGMYPFMVILSLFYCCRQLN